MNCVVEIDTDGLILSRKVNVPSINRRISELYRDVFGVDECHMILEEEEFGPGYFYKAKNYILRDPFGKLIKHGVKFKSSRYSPIYQKAMDRLAEAVLDGSNNLRDIAYSLQDMSQYSLDDFRMKTSIKKDPEEYNSSNALPARLGMKLRDDLGTEIGIEQVEYIVTRGRNYEIATNVTSLSEVDQDYYRQELEKVFELFGVPHPEQLTLF